jgi:hypothetical protein
VTAEADLDQLRRRVQHLEDRAAILDCIATHAQGYIKGSRDRTDPSYQRPLSLDTPADHW